MIYAKKAKQDDVMKDKGEKAKDRFDKNEGDTKPIKSKKGSSGCGC